MRLSLKARQVAGVTLIVGLSVIVVSAIHLAWITRISLEQSASRGELLARTVFQQATIVARPDDPYAALRTDPGIRSILQSGIAYSPNVTYAAIVDPKGVAVAHSSPVLEGQAMPEQPDLRALLTVGATQQLRAIYSDRTFEVRERLLMGNADFGSIRIGLSMLLVQDEIEKALRPAVVTAVVALVGAMAIALLFAQWMLQPIHVLKSGLTRLGRGEMDVKLVLPPGEEFADLGRSFETVSAELSSVRSRLAGGPAHFESIVDRLEDAVAVVSPTGDLLFANPAMRRVLAPGAPRGPLAAMLPAGHAVRRVLEAAIAARASQGPLSLRMASDDGEEQEHLVSVHLLEDPLRRLLGYMVLSRNLAYLGQVQSTLKYSRKQAALGRLLAGVAHEVKNPLNAMMIHLELMKQKLAGAPALRPRPLASVDAGGAGITTLQAVGPPAPPKPDVTAVLKHATIIGEEIHRLDEVVQGFLRFSRPEELTLRPVAVRPLMDDVAAVVGAEATARGVAVRNECPPDLPPINGDAAMLRQALLNLALNACQAMPEGGTLRFQARPVAGSAIEVAVADTGLGIAPEHLSKIFDLYFTTREEGSGIGLSMVYRTVHLHDGSIEVESTPGRGTTFRLTLPRA